MSFMEDVVSSSLMLCRSKNAEKKENPIFIDIYYMYIHVTTSLATMKITVKCRLTNHLLTKYCLLLNRPNVIRSPFQQAHSAGHQRPTMDRPLRWHIAGRPLVARRCVLFGLRNSFYFSENIRFGCLKEPSR